MTRPVLDAAGIDAFLKRHEDNANCASHDDFVEMLQTACLIAAICRTTTYPSDRFHGDLIRALGIGSTTIGCYLAGTHSVHPVGYPRVQRFLREYLAAAVAERREVTRQTSEMLSNYGWAIQSPNFDADAFFKKANATGLTEAVAEASEGGFKKKED